MIDEIRQTTMITGVPGRQADRQAGRLAGWGGAAPRHFKVKPHLHDNTQHLRPCQGAAGGRPGRLADEESAELAWLGPTTP